jgi:hypothetical protein
VSFVRFKVPLHRKRIHSDLCKGLGYDLIQWTGSPVRDGIPYDSPNPDAINLCAENFEWVVEESAKWLAAAKKQKPGK